MNEIAEMKNIERKIYNIRGVEVMLDSDLAEQYQCANGTKSINLAVKRNIERFPSDFYFQLNEEEFNKICGFNLKLQNNKIRSLPYVFTEQGVSMLSSVLKSKRAIQINVQIMRTFVKMRQWAIENKDMAQRLSELEHYFIEHCKDNEQDIRKLYEAIELLMDRTKPTKIGFIHDIEK